jgi:glucose/arabinose dehydrogenase
MHKGLKAAASLAAVLLSSAAALAQGAPNPPGNLEKLSNFQGTGASMDIPTIAQGGRKADAIARTLKQIKLPEGFKISLYAIVPDARHMAVGPQGVVTFVGTRKNKVYAVTDRDKDRVADEVKVFAPSIDFTIPNGVCFSRDGFLFIAEQNRVLMFPAAEFFYEGPGRGGLPAREGRRADPEGRGELQPHRPHLPGGARRQGLRVARPALQRLRPEKMDKYAKTGIGGIIRMDREGKNREVFATGIRNSVGMDFNPKDKTLWFTDNQVDGMGDDIPPGEINRADKAGMHFGFPYYGGGKVRTTEYKDQQVPANAVAPAGRDGRPRRRPRHDLLHGQAVPGPLPGRLLLGPARVLEPHHPGGRPGHVHEPEARRHRGQDRGVRGRAGSRPAASISAAVDTAVLADGSLLVSDDLRRGDLRISYGSAPSG